MKVIYTKKKQEIFVDDEDYQTLIQYKWYSKNKYAYNNKLGLMHRFLLKLTNSSIHCDHVDLNRSNNQKINLRICTVQENARNRIPKVKYKGVSYYASVNKYRAYITIDKKKKYLGYYSSDVEAAEKYDMAALYFFKEFARLNFEEKRNIYPEYKKYTSRKYKMDRFT